ncbi:hypothetical protein AGMMS49965_03690 [Bacteroidia bacterium]|nr:hypothetical protein AGMMS49965_03690 [Bacteroidia bacterium]
MKKIIYILFVFLSVALVYSCSEEQVGQPATSGVVPGQVRNPVAESIPGGAKITYDLPGDEDLLYVKAVWTVNGVEKNTSASLNSKTLVIKGFGSTDPQTVLLYSVSRSKNVSAPVSVPITPGTPPVRSISETIFMKAAFGGLLITWQNEAKEEISIVVQEKDDEGEMKEIDVIYSNTSDGNYTVRNRPAEEREFAVFVRDRWNNISEVKKAVLTPLYEVKLDKTLMARKILPGDYAGERGSRPWAFMFNDLVTVGSNVWHAQNASLPRLFTIDLSVTAQLSRYTYWHRYGYLYSIDGGNLKYWKVYGTNTLSSETSDDYWTATEEGTGWKKDWTLLADCESFKPSGMAIGSSVTQEDMDYASNGFPFDLPMEAPPVRYIRFHISETWGGIIDWQVEELSFWGQEIK